MSNNTQLLCASVVFLALASSLAFAPAVSAAQRTFVASSGVNNPNCSLTAPCRAFAAAIAQTDAGGEVIVLDSAGYGPVTITKSVSIIAPAGIYAGISVFSGDGVTISASTSDTVVLRGLTINNQGGIFGVHVTSAARTQIENCVLNGLVQAIAFEPGSPATLIVSDTVIRNGEYGIVANAAPGGELSTVQIWRSIVEHNQVTGIFVQDVARASIGETLVSDNGDGILLTSSTALSANPSLAIDRSQIVSNNSNGILAQGGGSITSVVNLSQSVVHGNKAYGVQAGMNGYIRLTGNEISGNTTGTGAINGGTIATIGNNMNLGNGSNGPPGTPIPMY